MNDFWTIAVSVAAIIQAIVVMVAIPITLIQVRQGTRARELSSLQNVFAEMATTDSRAARRRVLAISSPVAKWSKAQRRDVAEVGGQFQRIGFYARHKFVRRRLVMEMYSLLIVKLWESVRGYAIEERERIHAPRYWGDFETLAERAARYRRRKHLPIDGATLYEVPAAKPRRGAV